MHRWEWMKEKERRDEVKTAAIALFNKNLKCFILCWTLALSISIINIFLHAFAFNFLYNLSKNWTKSERSWRTLALFALGARFKLYIHTYSEICSVRLLPSPRCYHFLLIFILLLLKFQTFCFAVRLINISPHSCTVLLIVKRKNEKRKNFYIRFFYSSLCSMFASLFLFPSYHCILSINSTFNFLFSLRCTYCWAVVAAITIAAIVVRFCFCRSAFSFRSVHFIGLLCAIPIQLCSWLICAWFRNFSNFILKSGDIFAFESN